MSDMPEYGIRNLDYFYANGPKRQEFIDRGLIPTNNLSLYIVDEPVAERVTGIPNTHDYRQRPFGPVILALREQFPELWDQAQATARINSDVLQAFADKLFAGGGKDPGLYELADITYWHNAQVYDRIFRLIAPRLIELGIDTLDVCK